MASLISNGVGSGLDVNGLVTQLVAAERAPQEARLTRLDVKLTTEFTALSQFKGALSTFRSVVQGLDESSAFALRKTSTSDDTVLTGKATAAAAPGVYAVDVLQLAKASQLSSAAFAGGGTSAVGTGTLVLAQGSSSIELTIDSSNNTLEGIRDAINNATGNPGIRATLINAADGTRLVLSGGATGAANALRVTTSGGDGGLAQLVYDPPATANLSVLTAAQDAQITVAGFTINSATNTVEAIDGVTLDLAKAAPGTPVTFSVLDDSAGRKGKLEGFVKAWNTLAGTLGKLRSYDAETRAAGPMIGDSLLLGTESALRRLLGSSTEGAGDYASLSSLGITLKLDGTLELDATKLAAAETAQPGAVSAVFAGENGLAARFETQLARVLASDGDIALRDKGISTRRKDLASRQEALELRMVSIQARYLKQFSALDTLLARMQSTSSYLTQQLATSTQLAKDSGN